MTAQPAPDRRTWYVKRSTWRPCEHGDRVATCYHTPRCGPVPVTITLPPYLGGREVSAEGTVFGRPVVGWTRVRGSRQAERERAAWTATGWTAEVVPTSPQVRAEVRAWERVAQGYPGEAARPART